MENKWKDEACKIIESETQSLHEISMKLHGNPELAYQEKFAHDVLTTYLGSKGFTVEKKYKGMETAFRATSGTEGPTIAVLCEYDALPGIGHACGHNLIAVSGLAAGIAIKKSLEQSGTKGRIVVLGTPAEEKGGGKVDLINQGTFSDIDAAMMVHPCLSDYVYAKSLAIEEVKVTYKGRNAHAAMAPWEGINALDAVVMAYNSVSCLRQHIYPTDRIHGIISDGGKRPNIIPETSVAEFYIRSENKNRLQGLKSKVVQCFEGAAVSTGCSVDVHWEKNPYLDIITNDVMAELYTKNIGMKGVTFPSKEEQVKIVGGSTDMGNVSYTVPSIHAMYSIPAKSGNHTPEFTACTGSTEAHERTWVASKAMAMTAIDMFTNPSYFQQSQEKFKVDLPK